MKTDISKGVNEEKIVTLISKSASEMKGVTEMAETPEGLRESILARDVISRNGVRLSHDKEDNILIDVYIKVEYGIKIPQLAWELQRKVQSDVLAKTKLMLNDINIHVEGVDMGEKND